MQSTILEAVVAYGWEGQGGGDKHKAERERAQIGFRLSDTQTAEEEEIMCECAWQKPLAGDCRLWARWLMVVLMDLFRTLKGKNRINLQWQNQVMTHYRDGV